MTYQTPVFVCILFSLSLLSLSCTNSEEADPDLFKNARQFSLEDLKEARLTPERSFSIGSYQTVNDIGAIAADEAGNVYVVNEYNIRIEVYDKFGNNIDRLGTLGSDTGDYRDPVFLKIQGDQLYAFDNALNRAYQYTLSDLELVGVTELGGAMRQLEEDSLSSAQPVTLKVTAEGNYLVGFQLVNSTEDRRLIYYEVNEDGDFVSDRLLNIPNRKLHVDRAVDPPLIMMMPYEPEILIETDSQGNIYSIDTEHFLISVFDSTGQNLDRRYYPTERAALNRSDVVDLYTDTFQRRAIRRANLPDKWPALSRAFVDDQDRLWAATIVSNPDIYRWIILSPNGKPLAAFDLSREKQIEAVVGNTVYIKTFNAAQYSDQVKRYTLNF